MAEMGNRNLVAAVRLSNGRSVLSRRQVQFNVTKVGSAYIAPNNPITSAPIMPEGFGTVSELRISTTVFV